MTSNHPRNEYDRRTQDVGNIISLEHINLVIDDQSWATLFYVTGLGLTRDPFLHTSVENMWVNAGDQQFHLPSPGRMRQQTQLPTWAKKPQVLRGVIGLVVPSLPDLERRLSAVSGALADTKFSWERRDDAIYATCPWGNRFCCHAPDPRFGDMEIGVPYIQFNVPEESLKGILLFYAKCLMAPAVEDETGAVRIKVGCNQALIFKATGSALPEYDQHHFAIYVANFSHLYEFLRERDLVTMETNAHEYRFQDIIHPETGVPVFTVEHEVRSLHHPMFRRRKVNRNPSVVMGSEYRQRFEHMEL